jgi:MinD superfamily P-loop ATPase
MKIAIASGKGGTGKTSIAVSLAQVAEAPVHYVDCDVEEPNGHLFLQPHIRQQREIALTVPQVRLAACTGCGECRDLCHFNAITIIGRSALVFHELCHACGGCFLVCPEQALEEGKRQIGLLEEGTAGTIRFTRGTLRVGEAMAVPLINAVRDSAADSPGLVLLDAPPGTSCPLVATIRGVDHVLLVTEESPFGLHDLQLAVAVVRQMGLSFDVIINRADLGDDSTAHWCRQEGIRVPLSLPFDREIAAGYASGRPLLDCRPDLRPAFVQLLRGISP